MRSARVRAIYVPVTEPMRHALNDLAEREFRDPRDQAAYLITEGLRQRELLPNVKAEPAEPAEPARTAGAGR